MGRGFICNSNGHREDVLALLEWSLTTGKRLTKTVSKMFFECSNGLLAAVQEKIMIKKRQAGMCANVMWYLAITSAIPQLPCCIMNLVANAESPAPMAAHSTTTSPETFELLLRGLCYHLAKQISSKTFFFAWSSLQVKVLHKCMKTFFSFSCPLEFQVSIACCKPNRWFCKRWWRPQILQFCGAFWPIRRESRPN